MKMEKESVSSSSEPWNIAGSYVHVEVLMPLILCSRLKQIAEFGAEDMEDTLMMKEEVIKRCRIDAIYRFHSNLKRVMTNTDFCIKKIGREKFDELEHDLDEVKKVLSGIETKSSDQTQGTSTIAINEDHFDLCLKALDKINREIRKPLNDSELIFPASQEFNLEKLKDQLKFGG